MVPVESAADRLAMLSPDEFGVTVAVSGTKTKFVGIFDETHIEIDPSGDFAVSSTTPGVYVRTQDITTVSGGRDGTILEIQDVFYKVSDIQKQNEGDFSLVTLHEAD